LKFAGRYWNPYVEWREQGAWVRARPRMAIPLVYKHSRWSKGLIKAGVGVVEDGHFDFHAEAVFPRVRQLVLAELTSIDTAQRRPV
jgi:hypothetical protein